jgi:hypothetical protein
VVVLSSSPSCRRNDRLWAPSVSPSRQNLRTQHSAVAAATFGAAPLPHSSCTRGPTALPQPITRHVTMPSRHSRRGPPQRGTTAGALGVQPYLSKNGHGMPYPPNILDHHLLLPYRTPPGHLPPALPCIPWPQDPPVGTDSTDSVILHTGSDCRIGLRQERELQQP